MHEEVLSLGHNLLSIFIDFFGCIAFAAKLQELSFGFGQPLEELGDVAPAQPKFKIPDLECLNVRSPRRSPTSGGFRAVVAKHAHPTRQGKSR